jgi:hypothetical protein
MIINTNDYPQSTVRKAFNFLVQITNPKEIHPIYKDHIIHKDGNWAATDGHRLHLVEDSNLPVFDEGIYKIISKTKSASILEKTDQGFSSFPDFALIFPKGKPTDLFASKGYIEILTFVIRNLPENITIDPEYVKDLYKIDDYWNAELFENKNGPVKFQHSDKTALIMPIMLGS